MTRTSLSRSKVNLLLIIIIIDLLGLAARSWINTMRSNKTTLGLMSSVNADVLNSQHAGIGATWRINTKILSTCRGLRHIVAASGTACYIFLEAKLRFVWVISLISTNQTVRVRVC